MTSMQARRARWVNELAALSGSFGEESAKLVAALRAEVDNEGTEALLQHLRICGAVPEQYARDSSAEKLYSKYTDAAVDEALGAIGLRSTIITARADAADVQARGREFSLVADAKAFRLSRTAKNQKDFKVQAMDVWRGGLDFAVLVGPIYQFLPRTSQIYQQAIVRNVCLLSFAHLACLVALAYRKGANASEDALHRILKTVTILHPSKSAIDYWTGINRALVDSLSGDSDLWEEEKRASLEALNVVKSESLQHLRAEHNRLLGLSRQEAVDELVRIAGVDSRVERIARIEHGNLLGVS